MHHWEGLKFGRRDWKKIVKVFFMKSSFSFIAPCMQRYSAPALKEPFIGCLSVCFSKIQRKGREATVHASLVGQMLRNVPRKAQLVRPLNFLQAAASRSFCSMPLAGHSPTLPLVVLCNLFLTPVRESVVSPVQALSCFLLTLSQPAWLHICSLNVLFASRSDAETPQFKMPPHLRVCWVVTTTVAMRLSQGADRLSCTVSNCKALPALSPRTMARYSTSLWLPLNRKAFWPSLLHALACYGRCSHFLS